MSITTPYEINVPTSVEDDLSETIANSDDGGWEDEEELTETEEDTDQQEQSADKEEETDTAEEEEENEEEETTSDDNIDDDIKDTINSLQSEADAASEFLASHGIEYNTLVSEYQEYGKLTKSTLADLAKAGISEQLVAGYIQGQQARMDIYATRVQNIAGGEKEYAKLMKWAAKNLSDREIRHYDKAVESHDIEEARYAVENLLMRRKAMEGEPPDLVRGHTTKSTPAVHGFTSLEEMADAMNDPRYEHDAAYTRKVEARMLASNF